MKKPLQILTALLILQVLIGVVVYWPRSGEQTGPGQPLLSEWDVLSIASIKIEDGDGNQLLLSKQDGVWVLSEADDYPCKTENVEGLVVSIASITLGQPVTRTADSHKPLQVAEGNFVRKLTLESGQGEALTFYLGSSPSYGATHIRLEGAAETYLTSAIQAYQANAMAASWVDPAYLSLAQDEITAFRLQNQAGSWGFERDDAGDWRMVGLGEGEVLETSQVTTLLNRAASLNMLRPLGKAAAPAYGMDAPLAVLMIETESETITLKVGAVDPQDNTYVLKSSQSEYYVAASEYSVGAFIEAERAGFIQATPTSAAVEQPQTPVPTPTPES